jgi:pimeloyl-ACP methyl ester carboxylesterase
MAALRESIGLSGGRQASYEVVGAGEPALYFPGGPGFGGSLLREDAALLADRFAVHLIDPHGSGGSTPPRDMSAYDHVGHARFYEEVRKALGLELVTVMGFSFGSMVALTYAALFPGVTTRCIAIAARAVGEDEQGPAAEEEMERMLARHRDAPWYESARATWDSWDERALAATDPREVDAMLIEVLPLYTAHPERPGVRRLIETWRREAESDLAATEVWEGGLSQTIDLRPLLGDVRCPTLLLVGELDLICGPAHSEPIASAVPDAQVVIVPDSGHFVPAEAPEAFREAVVAFCDATPSWTPRP